MLKTYGLARCRSFTVNQRITDTLRSSPYKKSFVAATRATRIHSMWNELRLCTFVGLVLLTGCQSRQPTNVRHLSFGIFEVVDCKTSGMAPMNLKGSTEKYCLAAKPVVDETDIKAAEALRGES